VKAWVHIVPEDDFREHEPCAECWCCPTPDDEEPRIYVHHAMDQREQYETGQRLLS
jgi:hypothetical protein